MTTKEIKSEIQKLLDTVPDGVLQSLLEYLREAQKQHTDQSALAKHLRTVLEEDSELLAKLAK